MYTYLHTYIPYIHIQAYIHTYAHPHRQSSSSSSSTSSSASPSSSSSPSRDIFVEPYHYFLSSLCSQTDNSFLPFPAYTTAPPTTVELSTEPPTTPPPKDTIRPQKDVEKPVVGSGAAKWNLTVFMWPLLLTLLLIGCSSADFWRLFTPVVMGDGLARQQTTICVSVVVPRYLNSVAWWRQL